MPEMVAPRALVFRPLVKGNEALGTILEKAKKLKLQLKVNLQEQKQLWQKCITEGDLLAWL